MKETRIIMYLFLSIILLLTIGCGQEKGTDGKKSSGPTAPHKEGHAHNDEHGGGNTHEPEKVREIHLTQEQMKSAGIETAIITPERVNQRVRITGELEAIPDMQVTISSRFSGKIVKLLVQEGEQVNASDPLAQIDSVELMQADAAFHQAEAMLEHTKKNFSRVNDMAKLGIFSKATLEDAKNNQAEAKAKLEGAKANLTLAKKQNDRIRELQQAGIAALKDLEAAEADLTKARAEERAAREQLESASSRVKREELNYKKGHLTFKEVNEAEHDYHRALSDYRSALNTLEILGVNENDHGRAITITSPIKGVITALSITPGEAFQPTTPLMTVLDPSLLWLLADIYEKDLEKVTTGQKVAFTVSAYPGRSFRGRVSYISPLMNEKTRTVKARIQVPNSEGKLKVHMFARGWISLDAKSKILLVPLEALQKIGENRILYVQGDEPCCFVPTKVEAGESFDKLIEIKGGLAPGSRVVVKGSFSLKGEEQKPIMTEDPCCPE